MSNTSDLAEFFRCGQSDGVWVFEVAVVAWDGAHTPSVKWVPFRRWRTEPAAERLATARSAAMNTSRFFRTCTRCGELTNAGHMHSRDVCQSCAEQSLGVVY